VRIFFDSSALTKRYILEEGSEKINKISQKASEVFLSVIAVPELSSAFNRLVRERKISKKQYRQLKNNFLNDIAEATLIPLSENVLLRTILCLEKTSLKSLDAIHIASALSEEVDLFVTSDIRQAKAAKILKLKLEVI
jgi:predicted nucleic acid-binding protein